MGRFILIISLRIKKHAYILSDCKTLMITRVVVALGSLAAPTSLSLSRSQVILPQAEAPVVNGTESGFPSSTSMPNLQAANSGSVSLGSWLSIQ